MKNKKILIMEGNSVSRLLISSLLSEAGAYVQIVNSEEQLEVLNLGQEIDIAIIDVNFNGADGLSIIKKLVSTKGGDFLIIGTTNDLEKTKSEIAGISKLCHLIQKPFSIHQLKELIEIKKNDMEENYDLEGIELYSLSKIEGMSRGNQEFVTKMVSIFIDDIPKSLTIVHDAFEKKEYEKIRAAMHRIKPSLKMMSIDSIENDVLKLENICADLKNLDQVPVLIKKVDFVLQKVVKNLQ